MRVLVVTRQFPNARDPSFSSFNRQQFAALGKRCEVEVLATVPWFPGVRLFARWSAAGRMVDVPRQERIDGLAVAHPRYLYVPRIARLAGGALYAASLAGEVRRRRGRHDVVLGSWAFPDGVAAVALARILGVPAVVKVHGSDMNVLARNPSIAVNLRWALPRARRVVAVSRPLGDVVASFGVPSERIDIVPNGVDTALFHPSDRGAARAELGHGGDECPWLLYVGRLEESKGVLDLIEAFEVLARRRSDVRLAIVGNGSLRRACERASHGPLAGRILLAGPQPFERIPLWMAACDALVNRPELVESLIERTTEFHCLLLERVLAKVKVDYAAFYEPIASNAGPVVSPAMFERFSMPGYRRVIDLLLRHDVPLRVFCTTGGDLSLLLPPLLDAGINGLWISNIMTEAMEYRRLRREYGPEIALIGGIDSTALLRGSSAVRRAIEETVPPLLAQGHYLPCLDDRPRDNTPFAMYALYRELLAEIAERG